MEDVADNLFHPDPYYRQGGDMLRVGGFTYADRPAPATWAGASATCASAGRPLEPGGATRSTGWASLGPRRRPAGVGRRRRPPARARAREARPRPRVPAFCSSRGRPDCPWVCAAMAVDAIVGARQGRQRRAQPRRHADFTIETLDTDILILGAGGAGLCAALHAADARPRCR